jgi:hypothetical protein
MAFYSPRFVLFALLVLSAYHRTAYAEPPVVRIPRVSQPPKLEDFLGEHTGPETKVTGFKQRDPQDGAPVSQPTTAYLSYDDKNLYVVFVCKDEPGKVRAHLSKREDIFSDDWVGVFLDTYRDHHRAYEFLVNPLGIQADGIIIEGQNDDFTFDTVWHSEGKLTDDGYVVLIAIPFKSLRFSNADVQSWGIGLGREIVRSNEGSFWPYITHKIQSFTPQLATAEGLEHISPGRNIQLIPYGVFAHDRFLDETQPAFKTNTEKRVGLDAKFVIHDSLTLDVTANPDFSQVESDDPQVTVNQRFEVFFPEKRPFFQENANFFQTPENLFFSRRIGDPQVGARLTGRIGRWTIGALAIDDRAPGLSVVETDPLHGERAGIGIVRVQREIADQSTVGIFISSRDFAQSSNRVASIDTRIKITPRWFFTAQAITSFTHQLDGTRLSGPAYNADLSYGDVHANYEVNYLDRSPGFNADLGFIPRVDIRQISQFASYRWRPKKGRVVSFGPNSFTTLDWDRKGRIQDWRQNIAFQTEFKGQTFLFVRRAEYFELFQNLGFREHSNTVQFSTQWVNWLSVNLGFDNGMGVNYFPGSNLAPFPAASLDANAGVTFRPNSKMRFDQTYFYTRLGTRNGFLPPGHFAESSIFNNHIFRSKLTYQFTRELSLRAILDYNAVLANTDLIALDRSKRLTGDLLLTYLINPGTALYVGYTDSRENLLLDPLATGGLRRIGSPTTPIGRQVFVKVSYLFRL